MNKKYMANVRHNMNRAKLQEQKDREIIKGDLLVMCVALAAILICIVII